MVWDLRGALLKKEERESARLADFDFRLRARTFRLLAEAIGADEGTIVAMIAHGSDNEVIDEIALQFPDQATSLADHFQQCWKIARAQLISEIGNPEPYRLL